MWAHQQVSEGVERWHKWLAAGARSLGRPGLVTGFMEQHKFHVTFLMQTIFPWSKNWKCGETGCVKHLSVKLLIKNTFPYKKRRKTEWHWVFLGKLQCQYLWWGSQPVNVIRLETSVVLKCLYSASCDGVLGCEIQISEITGEFRFGIV